MRQSLFFHPPYSEGKSLQGERHRQVNGGKGVTEHLFENYAAAMD
ncbi:hypothetical protein [Candidatus Bandiella euplotis]|uniref:Transposase n=1 Tax=Candidatus Bandiella euplotis TaxID=1664265 RepID=A0ABZ0UM73_9RICK|nr:hypothetical protein [Candidatus Bandiella woodruffii]WPX97239.1 hypothetical protein Bandiella_01386 [Candidatus Bandiella woodruffii]